jgi:hypothetical protein
MDRTTQQPPRQAERPSHPEERGQFSDNGNPSCRGFGTLPSPRHAPAGCVYCARIDWWCEIWPIALFGAARRLRTAEETPVRRNGSSRTEESEEMDACDDLGPDLWATRRCVLFGIAPVELELVDPSKPAWRRL